MSPFDAVAAKLTAIAAAQLERRRQPEWWRKASLLWPLFTKG